jgi:tRNA(fMet)-specific endonuclease VapC
VKRYLLDTGIAGDYINRRRGVFERARSEVARGSKIGIGLPVLAELYFGIELSSSRDLNLKRIRHALATLTLWPFTDLAAAEYGRVAADHRRRGRTIQQIDIMAAAIAFSLGDCTVVSADSDLAAIPGLPVENWRT